jgi:hypothetical protein
MQQSNSNASAFIMVQHLGSFVQIHCYGCFKSFEKIKEKQSMVHSKFHLITGHKGPDGD